MTSVPTEETQTASNVFADAERCRREAKAVAQKHPERYKELIAQPSGWCVITEKGWWSRTYHGMFNEDQLRDKIERGHRVVLIVGLVAFPGVALTRQTMRPPF